MSLISLQSRFKSSIFTAYCNPSKFSIPYPTADKFVNLFISSLVITSLNIFNWSFIALFNSLSGILTSSVKSIAASKLSIASLSSIIVESITSCSGLGFSNTLLAFSRETCNLLKLSSVYRFSSTPLTSSTIFSKAVKSLESAYNNLASAQSAWSPPFPFSPSLATNLSSLTPTTGIKTCLLGVFEFITPLPNTFFPSA